METKPWLEHYDEGVPHTLQPYPDQTLLDVISDTAHQRPDHPASLFKGASLSYGEWERLSDALAAGLAALGVKKGDRVALVLPNIPQFLIAELGAWKAGAIAAPMNPLYTERELEHAFQECGAEIAVVLTRFYDKVKAVQDNTSLRCIVATNSKEYLPPLLRLLFTLAKEKNEGDRIALQAGDQRLGDLLRRHAGASRPAVDVGPQDPAIMLFSGGTTGTPKAAIGSHSGLLMSGIQIEAWFRAISTPWVDVYAGYMPLFHAYALAGVLPSALVGHHPLALIPSPRDLDDVIATIEKVRPAFLPGVPTLYIGLLNHPKVMAGKTDLRSIKACLSGAAPLMAETKQRFEAATGGHVCEGYSLTEAMMACCASPVHGTYKVGSVGMPLPDVEVRIVDAESGEGPLPAGQIGEILMRAPQLMCSYWQRPDETANAIRDGWLYTGDLGHLDEDGYLFVVDRKKDLIKVSGFQVWPREVEEVIASHPAVAEVGVAGAPDLQRGEAVMAWVVLRPGQQLTADELRAYCRERLTGYKVPRQIEFRDSLPKTMIGKVLRRELRAEKKAEPQGT